MWNGRVSRRTGDCDRHRERSFMGGVSRTGTGAFARRVLVNADSFFPRQSDRNLCHVLSRATKSKFAGAGHNQTHHSSRGHRHRAETCRKGPTRERILSCRSATAQSYRKLGLGSRHWRNQVLVARDVSRARFRSEGRATAIRRIL